MFSFAQCAGNLYLASFALLYFCRVSMAQQPPSEPQIQLLEPSSAMLRSAQRGMQQAAAPKGKQGTNQPSDVMRIPRSRFSIALPVRVDGVDVSFSPQAGLLARPTPASNYDVKWSDTSVSLTVWDHPVSFDSALLAAKSAATLYEQFDWDESDEGGRKVVDAHVRKESIDVNHFYPGRRRCIVGDESYCIEMMMSWGVNGLKGAAADKDLLFAQEDKITALVRALVPALRYNDVSIDPLEGTVWQATVPDGLQYVNGALYLNAAGSDLPSPERARAFGWTRPTPMEDNSPLKRAVAMAAFDAGPCIAIELSWIDMTQVPKNRKGLQEQATVAVRKAGLVNPQLIKTSQAIQENGLDAWEIVGSDACGGRGSPDQFPFLVQYIVGESKSMDGTGAARKQYLASFTIMAIMAPTMADEWNEKIRQFAESIRFLGPSSVH